MPIQRVRCIGCQAKSTDYTLCIIEHFVTQTACHNRQAGIVRCCLLFIFSLSHQNFFFSLGAMRWRYSGVMAVKARSHSQNERLPSASNASSMGVPSAANSCTSSGGPPDCPAQRVPFLFPHLQQYRKLLVGYQSSARHAGELY